MADRIVKVILRGDVAGLVAPLAVASKAVKGAADNMTSATKEAEKFRHGLNTVGDSAGKLGLVAAAGLGAVVLATANFDQAMSNVAAATHESTQNMELLRDAALEAGKETVFSASESAAAIESLAKAGVQTTDVLNGGLQGALDLAAAGGLEVADAADIAATALTQFKLAGADVPHVADLLAAAAGKAQGDVSDMGFALKQSGLVASQMGLSIEETTGTLAAFASAGLLGSDAGTSFRTMLLRLANPTEESSKLMEKLGISAYDMAGNFVGIPAIAGQLQTALAGQTQATRDAALATIFGSDAIRGAAVLYDQGAKGVQDWTEKVNDSGYAAETASTRLDNLKGDVEQFTGSLETALIGSGEGSQGAIRDIVQGATDITNAYNDMPGSVHNGTTSILAVTAVAGVAVFAFSRIVQSIANTRQALDQLGPAGVRAGRLLKTGLAAFAIVEGLSVIDDAIDSLFNKKLDGSNLGRSLEALSNGQVAGELAKSFGSDLEELSKQIDVAAANMDGVGRNISDKLPSFLSDKPFDGSPGIKQSAENVAQLDQALAGLVESGQADKAAVIIEQLKKIQDDPGDVDKVFSQYGLALENLSSGLDETTSFSFTLNDAMSTTGSLMSGQLPAAYAVAGGAVTTFAAQQEQASEQLKEAREVAGDTAREFFGLGESVDDAKVSLGGWITQLEEQAQALEDFTSNAKKAAENGIRDGLVKELEAAGPAGALRLQQLADATDAEVRRANRAWVRGQQAIADYVGAVVGVPPAELSVKNQKALNQVAEVINALQLLGLTINDLPPIPSKLGVPVGGRPGGGRDGDPKTPFAEGGYTGVGGKYEPAGVVHRGEYVFSAAATHGNEAYLDSLHRSMRGYASGGYVTAAPMPSIDYERLANMRPMWGDVHVKDGQDFLRTLQQAKALSSLGGARQP